METINRYIQKTCLNLLLLLLRAYKLLISPLFGNCCRFHPSCSTYSYEALQTHGIIRGIWLTARRLVKCQPFHPGGYDPVPGTEKPALTLKPPHHETNGDKPHTNLEKN